MKEKKINAEEKEEEEEKHNCLRAANVAFHLEAYYIHKSANIDIVGIFLLNLIEQKRIYIQSNKQAREHLMIMRLFVNMFNMNSSVYA